MAANEPTSAAQQLQNLYHIVHLVYHRNKNQHRRSLWWRHLNSFRRDLRTLSAAAAPTDDPPAPSRPADPTDGGDPAAPPPAARPPPPPPLPPSLRPLLRRWARDRVPRWRAAFGGILAERRFVAVGLVLLAALAQAADVLGVRGMMEEDARERAAGVPGREAADVEGSVGRGEGVDLGVVVERGAVEAGGVEVETKRTEGRKRRKRRKGNVIDDLFDELG
jgi:ribonuclease MRP protein subunit RMP1